MPITSSAKKAFRASKRKRVFNLVRKEEIRKALKSVRTVAATAPKEARAALSQAYKALDKATKTGLIKKNTASRKKSRLAQALKKLALK